VIALNYSKSPWAPFPTGLHDAEALYLAVVDDQSLPIDVNKVAVGGFSAGGNLSLGLCQLPSIRNHARAVPKAVVPVYPPLDFTIDPIAKKNRRPYKPGQLAGIRGESQDFIFPLATMFDWAYIPYGADLKDPLLSPVHAQREVLPPFVCLIAAELDFLAFEAWSLASRLANRPAPEVEMAGRAEKAVTQELEVNDERFWFESKERGIKWILVPDVVHGFDLHDIGKTSADAETARDGDAKGLKVIKVLGEWLLRTAWKD
jgi:hypothetical protein